MRPVNLVPRERLVKQMTRRRRRAWVKFLRTYSAGMAVVAGLVMLPAHASVTTAQESTLTRLDSQITKWQADIDKNRGEFARLTTVLKTSRFVGDHPDWSLVMEAVSRCRSETVDWWTAWGHTYRVASTDIALEGFQLVTGKEEIQPAKKPGGASGPAPAGPARAGPMREVYTIRLTGFASSPIGALKFVRRLERLDFAERVAVKETRPQPIGGAMATHFDIEIVVPGDRITTASGEGGSK
ncbi:MAG TPA: hypothetical protein VHC70_01010 [Phycisphaerales bacterium]|jgi:hypothetical protein|nr:hypothetical protein [Phycisphaerales bacterium]